MDCIIFILFIILLHVKMQCYAKQNPVLFYYKYTTFCLIKEQFSAEKIPLIISFLKGRTNGINKKDTETIIKINNTDETERQSVDCAKLLYKVILHRYLLQAYFFIGLCVSKIVIDININSNFRWL